ncbi:hypothetical protein [Pseudomonas sp. TWI929]|uniref:hypothetical protein n=1 Tax=Pseudomonas sp. TWI929 TaxID=3136795 RepID=UPI00320AC97B
MSSIKERFESHPLIFGCSLLLTGLLTGVPVAKFLLSGEDQSKSVGRSAALECTIDGLPSLAEAHDKRVFAIQGKLLEIEAKATDPSLISSYQEKYLDSAVRVRADIDVENAFYNKSVETLRAKCKYSEK